MIRAAGITKPVLHIGEALTHMKIMSKCGYLLSKWVVVSLN